MKWNVNIIYNLFSEFIIPIFYAMKHCEKSLFSKKIRIYFCAITKKLYIRLVYLNPWIFISNKNNNIKTFLLIFLLFCILYIFFHVVGHTTTVFCPQPFQKNSPNYRRDLCLGQMSNLHYLLIKVTWEILWYTTKMYFVELELTEWNWN